MRTQKKTESTPQKAIQITLSNALDQSDKRLIEIGPSQTVRQAVVDAKMAPSSQFDVFSSVGEVVTNRVASQVDGETLYVGPARIAGGSRHLTLDGIRALSIDFPTILPVHEMIRNSSVQMFSVRDGSARRALCSAY